MAENSKISCIKWSLLGFLPLETIWPLPQIVVFFWHGKWRVVIKLTDFWIIVLWRPRTRSRAKFEILGLRNGFKHWFSILKLINFCSTFDAREGIRHHHPMNPSHHQTIWTWYNLFAVWKKQNSLSTWRFSVLILKIFVNGSSRSMGVKSGGE